MFTLKVKFYKNGHLLEGFIHKNRHGEYYPSKDMAYQFNNVIDAILTRDALNEKLGLVESKIINLESGEVNFNKEGCIEDLRALESIIYDMIRFKGIEIIDLRVGPVDNGIEVIWNEVGLTVTPEKLHFNAIDVTWTPLESKRLFSYDAELVQSIAELSWCYMSGISIQHILDAYNVDISQTLQRS